jgi:PAS domain S-box-containing protein
VDAVNIALQLAFILIFIVVLVRYLRQPRVVHRDLVLVFASVVALFAIAIAVKLWPALPRGISSLSAAVLLLQPYFTLRLARHFVPFSRKVATASLVWFAVAVAAVAIGTRGNLLTTVVVVGYFVTIEAAAAFFLQRASGTRVGYAGTRLRIAAAATFLFAAGILVAGAGSAATASGGTVDPAITFISRLIALGAGVGYLAAFLPPLELRRLQQRAVAFDLGQTLLAAPVDGDPDSVWIALAREARMITNGPAAVVALGEPPRVRIVAGEPPAELTIGATYAGPTPEQLDERSGPGIIAVPIESDLGRQGWLIVYPDAGSLFLEDDLVLLRLLTTQAARANERREAIRQQGVLASELEDASHELATSRAQLESEARFRAALEAHPGILLVIEPGGRIGYANGQALRSLGYDANAIRRVGLSELLVRDPAAEGEDHGSGEARRRDGTTFPVDFAVSPFESRGELSWIAVLTDISARIEADHLRDTFIGILSHELRTPVTAIYGGSQVLLARGERLDRTITRELVTDIAAEAERLHRLIENLLVLARVERGEDLVGGEPVLLQHVLPSIVDRERSLWLGTEIAVNVPPGLPTVRGHDGYVAQVIRNLLSNATKYGGPSASIEIVADGGADGVVVRVLDGGPGIDASTAERLFDLYYRAPGSAVRAPGAGIGLFVCRRIVTALGGTIWARERPGGGAEFGFSLPVYEADDDTPVGVTDGELAAAS